MDRIIDCVLDSLYCGASPRNNGGKFPCRHPLSVVEEKMKASAARDERQKKEVGDGEG